MNDDVKSLLTRLGCNEYEAKSYYILLKHSTDLTHKKLSTLACIPYGKSYEVVNSLVNKGFCMIIPEQPLLIRAVNIKDVIEKFISTTKKIADKLSGLSKVNTIEQKNTKIFLIYGRSNIYERLITLDKNLVKALTSDEGLGRLKYHRLITDETIVSLDCNGHDILIFDDLIVFINFSGFKEDLFIGDDVAYFIYDSKLIKFLEEHIKNFD